MTNYCQHPSCGWGKPNPDWLCAGHRDLEVAVEMLRQAVEAGVDGPAIDDIAYEDWLKTAEAFISPQLQTETPR